MLPGSPLVWTLLAILPYLLPTLLYVLESGLNALRGTPVRTLLARSRVDDALMGDKRRAADANDIRAALGLYRRADGILLAFVAMLAIAFIATA